MITTLFRTFVFTGTAFAVVMTLPSATSAQNYINSREYANPNVLIDLSVIEQEEAPAPTAPSRMAPPIAATGAIPSPEGMIYPAGQAPQDMAEPQEMVTSDGKIRLQPPAPKATAAPQETIPAPKPATVAEKQPEPAATLQPEEKIAVATEAPASMPVEEDDDEAPAPGTMEEFIAERPANEAPSALVQRYARDQQSGAVPQPADELGSGTEIAAYQEPTMMDQEESAEPVADVPEETSGAVYDMASGEPVSIFFDSQSADISADDQEKLNAIARKLKDEPGNRVQLKAFAEGTPETASSARRLSLTRALKVRSFLMEQGLRATQMDVRALGTGTALESATRDGLSANRVDVVLMN